MRTRSHAVKPSVIRASAENQPNIGKKAKKRPASAQKRVISEKRSKTKTEFNAPPKEEPKSEMAIDETTFLSMNDDCIFEVLNFLNLNGLCAVAQTCQRLHRLAKENFHRRFQVLSKEVERLEESGNGLCYDPNVASHLTIFSTIRKVTLGKWLESVVRLERIAALHMNRPDDYSVKEIRFGRWSSLRPVHAKTIKDMIKHAEDVTFARTKILGEFHNCILQYLPAMKKLTIFGHLKILCDRGDYATKYKWLTKTYPKLEYFAWLSEDELNFNRNVKQFFRQNATIERVSLTSSDIENVVKFIQNGVNIGELFFRVERNVQKSLTILKQIYAVKPTNRLHLLFTNGSRAELDQNHNHLVKLKENIDGLYFDDEAIEQPLADCILKIDHLKILQIAPGAAVETLTQLPYLEEVYMANNLQSGAKAASFYSLLIAFVYRCPNLKKLFFRNHSNYQSDYDYFGRLMNVGRELQSLLGFPQKCVTICVDTPVAVHVQGIRNKVKIVPLDPNRIKNPLVKKTYSGNYLNANSYRQRIPTIIPNM